MKRMILVTAFVLCGCSDTSTNNEVSSLDKISSVFRGADSPEQVKQEVNTLLALYNQPQSEEVYTEVGDLIVFLAENDGKHTEMDFVRCITAIKRKDPQGSYTIKDGAKMCAGGFSVGL